MSMDCCASSTGVAFLLKLQDAVLGSSFWPSAARRMTLFVLVTESQCAPAAVHFSGL